MRGIALAFGAEIDEESVVAVEGRIADGLAIDMPAGPYNDARRAHISGPTPGMKLLHSGGYQYKLFDLEADPDERKDLGSDKERLQEAIKKMNAFRGRLKEIEVKPPR